jgi:hypothetical protein
MTKRASYYTPPDGCSKHSTCATCPFPDCEAHPKDIVKLRAIDPRHTMVLKLHSIGLSAIEIMKRTGYKDRGTIYRILKEGG